jgi:hypothetical protein
MEEILSHPMVSFHQSKLSSTNKIDFSIPLSEALQSKLQSQLHIKLTTLPLRWIKGDTPLHRDKGPSQFQYTHLIYLTSSAGEFILDGESHPIVAGDAHIFQEGTEHGTRNTGTSERLLLGPISESGFMVGASLTPVVFVSHIPVDIYDLDYFVYTTPYESPKYNTITLFRLPPPLPTSVSGVFNIENYTTGNKWSSRGKIFVGWKLWGIEGSYPLGNQPVDKIYKPGETYTYDKVCILYPYWVDIQPMTMHFTDNAQVFYKPHSLSSGSGGVRNYRHKQRKT